MAIIIHFLTFLFNELTMKKSLLILFSLAHLITYPSQEIQNSSANVVESFFYGSVGAYNAYILPLPSCGLGYRFQYNHIGLDFSIDATPLLLCNILRISPAILFYPRPDSFSQMYAGVACGCLFFNFADVYREGWNNYAFCLPELVVGYQYQRSSGKNNFIEFRLGAPIIRKNSNTSPYDRYASREYAGIENSANSSPKIIPCANIKFGFEF